MGHATTPTVDSEAVEELVNLQIQLKQFSKGVIYSHERFWNQIETRLDSQAKRGARFKTARKETRTEITSRTK